MFESILNPSSMPLLKELAKFTEHRKHVLTENIARIDTPDYKSRDLPVDQFQRALSQAVSQMQKQSLPYPNEYMPSLASLEFPSLSGVTSSAVQPTSNSITELFTDDLYQAAPLPDDDLGLQDHGKRNIDFELIELQRAYMQHSHAMQLMKAQYDLLESVISGRA